MSVADDQTVCAPDESATGIVTDDIAVGAASDETLLIAPADAVTHLDQLAWTEPDDVVEDSATVSMAIGWTPRRAG